MRANPTTTEVVLVEFIRSSLAGLYSNLPSNETAQLTILICPREAEFQRSHTRAEYSRLHEPLRNVMWHFPGEEKLNRAHVPTVGRRHTAAARVGFGVGFGVKSC